MCNKLDKCVKDGAGGDLAFTFVKQPSGVNGFNINEPGAAVADQSVYTVAPMC